MAIKLTAESFLKVVKQSGLVEPDRLKKLLQEFQEQGVDVSNAKAIAEALVDREAVTAWQAGKLQQGKHKGFFLGKYRLLSLLGKGGMSSVYLAEHVLMRRRCAIKVLPAKRVDDSSYLGRFHREAQAVAALDHNNIVRAYDVDQETEGSTEIHFLVMEYVEGRDLHTVVQEDGTLPFVDAADYIRQAADGLTHAHEAGMVHRDIKPANLLVDMSGTVKILDLGLARFFDESDEESLTVANDEKVLGTADYLAPEQALDSHTVDERADIYSLGCTLYFMLTAHPPFTEGTLPQRLMAHQMKQPPSVAVDRPEIPPGFLAIVEKMMAKNRDERQQTAAAVAEDMQNWLIENAGDEWKQKHSAITHSGSGSSTTNGIPVVAPAAPVACQAPIAAPVSAAQVPAVPAASVADEGDQLGSFLNNLGGAAAPVAPPAAPLVTAQPAAAPPAAPVVAPAVAAVPSAAPVAAPVAASPAVAAPVAAAVVPTAAPLAAHPVASGAIPTGTPTAVAAGETTKTARKRKKKKKAGKIDVAALLAKAKENKKILMAVGGGLGAVLLALVAMSFFGGDDDDGSQTPDDPKVIADAMTQQEGIDAEITVGKNGLNTIELALIYFKKFPPEDEDVTPTITVPGGKTYKERIIIDGGDFYSGIKIVSSGSKPAVLAPGGSEPIIELVRISTTVIDGFEVQAKGTKVAVRLEGTFSDSALKNLKITDFSETGILGIGTAGYTGFEGTGTRGDFDHIVLVGGAKATGMQFLAEDAFNNPSQLRFTSCRFLGPMQNGIVFKCTVRDIEIRESIFSQGQTGIKLDASDLTIENLLIANNTFHKLDNGIVFTDLPIDGSKGIDFSHNLFADIKGPEVLVEAGFNQAKFQKMSAPKGSKFNLSSRAKPAKPVSGSLSLLFAKAKSGQQGVKVEFASTKPSEATFLKPKAKSPTPPAGPAKLKPYVGAVKP